MLAWLLTMSMLWGSTCGDALVVDPARPAPIPGAALAVHRGGAAPPACVPATGSAPVLRWPASGTFWVPLELAASGPPAADPVLAVRAPGARQICVHWPRGGRREPVCRGAGDGTWPTLYFPLPGGVEPGSTTWVGITGTLYRPPALALGEAAPILRQERRAELAYGVFFGLLVALSLLALLGFHVRGMASYGWFAAFLLAFGLAVAGFTGRGLALLGGVPVDWLLRGPLLAALGALFFFLGFVRRALGRGRSEDEAWRGASAGLQVLALLAVAPVLVLGPAVLLPVAVLTMLAVIVVATQLVRLAMRGSRRGRLLLGAVAVPACGALLGAGQVVAGGYAGMPLAHALLLAGVLLMALALARGVFREMVGALRGRDRARGELLATQRLALLRVLYCRITGLPRRQKLAEMFDNLVERGDAGAGRVAVLLVQIDNLSVIRQHHGREALEALVIGLAARIREGLEGEQVVGRLDDWDFAIVLPLGEVAPEAVEARVQAAAAAVLRCFDAPVSWRGTRITSLASIGVALRPDHGEGFGELLRHCDSALFDARAEGGNRVRLYSEQRHLQRANRWARLDELAGALEQGQLRMVYQPIHAAVDGALLGVEALVRWRREDGETLLPGEFVPLAEETDLILALGHWTATTAIEDLAWLERHGGYRLFLSLNVSPRQLVGQTFFSEIARLLRRAGIAPGRVHIEITENRLVEGLERTRRLLTRMARWGLRVYVDDFGVGYSSLSYLRELPIHGLKIDRSFVRNIGRTAQDETVLATVLRLAHGLELDIIAEGVENARQATFLAAGGCQGLQGHHFAEAMSRDALLAYLRRPPALRTVVPA